MGFLKRLFGGKDDTKGCASFEQRVDKFWAHWVEQAERFSTGIDRDGGSSLSDEITKLVARLGPGFAWVFGPGGEGARHSFTLSPEGDRNRLFLTEYWRSRAPRIPGWTFHSSRQPTLELGGHRIEIGGVVVEASQLWVSLESDEERELHHVTVGAPQFGALDEDITMRIVFLWLDEALGENGTEEWLGAIELGDREPEGSIALPALRETLLKQREAKGWHVGSPLETYSGYRLPEPLGDFPRGDTLGGTTRNMGLVGDYLENGGEMEDPVAGTGAEYFFAMFPRESLPEGGEVDARSALEDVLERKLSAEGAGTVLGGATGLRHAYVDLLGFDGERSRKLVEQVFDEQGFAGAVRFEPFGS